MAAGMVGKWVEGQWHHFKQKPATFTWLPIFLGRLVFQVGRILDKFRPGAFSRPGFSVTFQRVWRF